MVSGMWSPDYIYASVQRVEPPCPDAVINRIALVADLPQLIAGYDAVLIASQIPRFPRHPNPFVPPLIGRLES